MLRGAVLLGLIAAFTVAAARLASASPRVSTISITDYGIEINYIESWDGYRGWGEIVYVTIQDTMGGANIRDLRVETPEGVVGTVDATAAPECWTVDGSYVYARWLAPDHRHRIPWAPMCSPRGMLAATQLPLQPSRRGESHTRRRISSAL